MALDCLTDLTWSFDKEAPAYEGSFLSPPAPENAHGEVLLGAAYRALLLGVPESRVDLSEIEQLSGWLAANGNMSTEVWEDILDMRGLGSPRLRGQKTGALPQLSPFVPEIARYACVRGARRGRWNPANLLFSAIAAGSPRGEFDQRVGEFRDALDVQDDDDVLARFVEQELRRLPGVAERSPEPPACPNPATRTGIHGTRTPAEQFVRDLRSVVALKSHQTRKQWTVLVEAMLRLGMTTHFLWICRLNARIWDWSLEAVEQGGNPGWQAPSVEQIETDCWEGHHRDQPLLELGSDTAPHLKRWLREYFEARIGFNVLMHAVESASLSLPTKHMATPDSPTSSASGAVVAFLQFLGSNAVKLREVIYGTLPGNLREVAGYLADSQPALLSASDNPAKQRLWFLRYAMGQLQPREDERRSYDQAYLTAKANRAPNAPWIVQPGPAMLLFMVHGACRAHDVPHESIDGFRRYLGAYGIYAPVGGLIKGVVGQHLEQLGLSVDSADAGGGRLLLDPFRGTE